MRLRLALTLWCINSVVLSSCGGPQVDSLGPPQWKDTVDDFPAAEMMGHLVIEGQCVDAVDVSGTKFALLVPPGTQTIVTDRRRGIQLADGNTYVDGDEVRLGGGELADRQQALDLVGEDQRECLREPIFIVSSIGAATG